jgi:hypothetical protein
MSRARSCWLTGGCLLICSRDGGWRMQLADMMWVKSLDIACFDWRRLMTYESQSLWVALILQGSPVVLFG